MGVETFSMETLSKAERPPQPFVAFSGVRKTYDGRTLIVRDLNLSIAKGEFLTLLGPSGSGKTTGSGQALARAFLENGFGGLVLCAKADERRNAQANEAGCCVKRNHWLLRELDCFQKRAAKGRRNREDK